VVGGRVDRPGLVRDCGRGDHWASRVDSENAGCPAGSLNGIVGYADYSLRVSVTALDELPLLDGVQSVLARVAETPLWSLGSAELVELLSRAGAVVAAAQAVLMRAVGEADARDALVAEGATSSTAWLRARLRLAPTEAGGYVKTARALRDLHTTAAACAHGEIGLAHAGVIARTVADLPDDGTLRADAERDLVAHAQAFDAVQLSRIGRRLLAVVHAEAADVREADVLARAEDRAARAMDLTLTADGEGGAWLRGRLDSEATAVVRAALDPLAAPRPTAADGPDLRPAGRRRAEALVAICRTALAAGDLPDSGGDRPQVVVTVPLDTLTSGIGAATLEDGTPISPAAARRIACDAGIIPAVLGSRGEPLDVGRSRRLFTGPLRRALVLRDVGCAFPGCDRPPRWCEAHHIVPWARGGATAVANGVLLCGHHHRLVEQGDWEVTLAPDGAPEFRPPPWIDPDRTPLRNRVDDLPARDSPGNQPHPGPPCLVRVREGIRRRTRSRPAAATGP